jgi:hypothetical protein
MHFLSRLHIAAPPEKELRATTSSALNQTWREASCLLTPSVSGRRLAPT